MSTACAPKALAKRAFCSTSATVSNVIKMPSPPSACMRLPSPASITWLGVNASPTDSAGSKAPANPAEIIKRDGKVDHRLRRSPRRFRSNAAANHDVSFFSKTKASSVPLAHRCGQSFTNGETSRSSAATIASSCSSVWELALGVSIRPKPLHRPPQRFVHGTGLPSQFALRFGRLTNIFLRPMRTASMVARGSCEAECPSTAYRPRRSPAPPHTEPDFRRGQSRNRRQLVENLLQRQILSAQNVTLARFFPLSRPPHDRARIPLHPPDSIPYPRTRETSSSGSQPRCARSASA